MEDFLPDCTVCKSEYGVEIDKAFRKKSKVLPLAREYAPKFNTGVENMRKMLTKHVDNLHRKYKYAKKWQSIDRKAEIEEKFGIDFEEYKDKALEKALLALESGAVKVKPTDIAALENVSLQKQKLGLEKEAMKVRMAAIMGGFTTAIEGEEVKDESGGILESGTN